MSRPAIDLTRSRKTKTSACISAAVHPSAGQRLTFTGLRSENACDVAGKFFCRGNFQDVVQKSMRVPRASGGPTRQPEIMFPSEELTNNARTVLMIAQAEAEESGKAVRTEHILLGLMEEDTGYAANMLKNAGVNVEEVRVEVEKITSSRPGSVFGTFGTVYIPFTTDRAARVLDISWRESRERGA
jgi:hypothetical protein